MQQRQIVIEGQPRGKGRHRSRIHVAKGFHNWPVLEAVRKGKVHAQTYSDPKTVLYEDAIRKTFQLKYPRALPWTGSIFVVVIAYYAIPKATSKIARKAMNDRVTIPNVMPDWDNIAKVTDALNGLAWHDDKQVQGCVFKFYNEKTRLVIRIIKDFDIESLMNFIIKDWGEDGRSKEISSV